MAKKQVQLTKGFYWDITTSIVVVASVLVVGAAIFFLPEERMKLALPLLVALLNVVVLFVRGEIGKRREQEEETDETRE